MAASRRWALIYAFWQWFGRAPAGVKPLEVRFAHPVRLSPATHSQGHGRPCLQRLHHRRGFYLSHGLSGWILPWHDIINLLLVAFHFMKFLYWHFHGAPHRPIAFSFHKSLPFLVNFFQDDTFDVARK